MPVTMTTKAEQTHVASRTESTVRAASGGWWVAGLGLSALIAVFFGETLIRLSHRWANEADYSHGFLVPLFSAYLLWYRRDLMVVGSGGRWLGLLLLAGSAVLRIGSAYYAFPLADGVAIPLCLAGAVLLLGGWSLLGWSWPAIAFLMFMIPLPAAVSERLSGPLQHIATVSGTYLLQTFGVPAAAVGNVIHLSHEPPIMVVEQCSGLRMLICFIAITMGAAFVVDWGLLERLVIILSGIPIAVVSNVTRITATGLVQEHFGPEVAEKIFHDFAGWLMMPFACLLVALELWLLSRMFPSSRDDGIGAPVRSNWNEERHDAPQRAIVQPVRGKPTKQSR
jgi:exosortase